MERIQEAIEKARALKEGRTGPRVAPPAADQVPEARPQPMLLEPELAPQPQPKPQVQLEPQDFGQPQPQPDTSRRPEPSREPEARRQADAPQQPETPVPTAAPTRTVRTVTPDPAQAQAASPLPQRPPASAGAQVDGPAKTVPPRPVSAPAPASADAPNIPRPRTAPRAPRFHLSETTTPVWNDLRPFKPDPGLMRRNRIVSYERTDDAHISYDMMRTRLLRILRENNWMSVAITSPGSNCGKTTTTLNLAFSLAYQQDTRTVVLDVDLRRPQMAKMLGLKEVHSMARILDGTGRIEDNFVRYGDTLAIGTNERASRHPSELLQHKSAGSALAALKAQLSPDVILYDMPPMMSNDDVMAFLPHVDCVLLVAAAEATTIEELDRCERELGEQTNVLGIALNKCRYMPQKYGYG